MFPVRIIQFHNLSTYEYFFVFQVVRVWKEDDVYMEKAFKATVSEVKNHKDSIERVVPARSR